jgi:hypothetical protein
MAQAVDPMLAGCNGRAGLADFKVRAIERTDRAQWASLWRAYLDFYRARWSDEVADATFATFSIRSSLCMLWSPSEEGTS